MPYNTPTKLNITSSAFEAGQKIPVKYTCDSKDVNPEIKVDNLPAAAKSLAIILEDPDAPKGIFIHWVCWNLPPETIAENTSKGKQGINSFGENGYKGPCPPKGKPHHYNFLVFALDAELDIPGNATREALEKAMQNHILAKGELQGLYGTD